MKDQEMVGELLTRAAEYRAKAEACESAAALLNGSAPGTPPSFAFKRTPKAAKKPRRVSNALRPTSGRTGAKGKRGETRGRVETYLRDHPKATQGEIGRALGISQATAGYHLTQIRKGRT